MYLVNERNFAGVTLSAGSCGITEEDSDHVYGIDWPSTKGIAARNRAAGGRIASDGGGRHVKHCCGGRSPARFAEVPRLVERADDGGCGTVFADEAGGESGLRAERYGVE